MHIKYVLAESFEGDRLQIKWNPNLMHCLIRQIIPSDKQQNFTLITVAHVAQCVVPKKIVIVTPSLQP